MIAEPAPVCSKQGDKFRGNDTKTRLFQRFLRNVRFLCFHTGLTGAKNAYTIESKEAGIMQLKGNLAKVGSPFL